MQIVLTIDLQQNNGTSIAKGTQTMGGFTGADVGTAINFLKNESTQNLIRMLGWRADSKFTFSNEPVTIPILGL